MRLLSQPTDCTLYALTGWQCFAMQVKTLTHFLSLNLCHPSISCPSVSPSFQSFRLCVSPSFPLRAVSFSFPLLSIAITIFFSVAVHQKISTTIPSHRQKSTNKTKQNKTRQKLLFVTRTRRTEGCRHMSSPFSFLHFYFHLTLPRRRPCAATQKHPKWRKRNGRGLWFWALILFLILLVSKKNRWVSSISFVFSNADIEQTDGRRQVFDRLVCFDTPRF